jgi:lipopolysaccharide assembly outer membrane protein LptD (OstA)
VEPYLNYTFAPEPTLMPEELRQFDSVDSLRDEHNVKVGCRNKWQAKRKKKTTDLFDVDLYATCPADPAPGGHLVSNLVLDAEMEPIDDLTLDIEATYNVDESDLDKASAKCVWTPSSDWGTSVEYRYTKSDKSSQLSATMDLFKKRPWSLSLTGRYDLEEDRLEEAWAYVQRTYDCMAIRLGAGTIPAYTTTDGAFRDDEYKFTLEFWLTAFPTARLKGKHTD